MFFYLYMFRHVMYHPFLCSLLSAFVFRTTTANSPQICPSLSPTNDFRGSCCVFPLHLRCFNDRPFGIEDQPRLETGSNFQKELAERR